MIAFDQLSGEITKPFSFHIKHINNFYIFEDEEIWNDQPAFGYAFEDAMTISSSLSDTSIFHYRMISYSLLNIRLLVTFEIDCVRSKTDNSSIELKTCNILYEPRYRHYYYQMILSDTKYLCLGKINKQSGIVEKLEMRTIGNLLSREEEARCQSRWSQLGQVLQWLQVSFQTNLADTATLTFDPNHCQLSLTMKPSASS
jgi:hypothetical protein